MRKFQAARLASLAADSGSVLATGEEGEQLRLQALTPDIFRVSFRPEGTPRQPRTWTVVGAAEEVPRSGRLKDDLAAAFPDAPAGAATAAGELATSTVRAVVDATPGSTTATTAPRLWSASRTSATCSVPPGRCT